MDNSLRAMLSNFPESSLQALTNDDSGHLKKALIGLAYIVEAQEELICDQQDSLKEALGCSIHDELVGFEGRQEVLESHLEFLRSGQAKMKSGQELRGEVVRFPSHSVKSASATDLGLKIPKIIPFSPRGEENLIQ